jgi:formylglycine-generating enzyme
MGITNPLKFITAPPGLPGLRLVLVEGHEGFEMGGKKEQDEQPIHTVQVNDFYMATHLVTQALWKAIMVKNPSGFKGDTRPVERVSWNAICEKGGFLDKLNSHAIVSAWQREYGIGPFRLPCEAEWEYAARGGIYQQPYQYAGSEEIDEVAWCDGNSHEETKPVGLKAPNALGIYDMSGNVWEWCADDWHSSYKGAPAIAIPWIDQPRAAGRVLRGGGWYFNPVYCRVASRTGSEPGWGYHGIGLRLVASLSLSGSSGLPLSKSGKEGR